MDALTTLICEQRRFLTRYAMAKRIPSNQIPDLVQDTMLRAWQKRHRFAGGDNIRQLHAWLSTILIRLYITQYRQAKFRSSYERSSEPMVQECQALELLSTAEKLSRINSLSPAFRDALLGLAEGIEYRELARTQGIPLGTLKSRVNRAREALMEVCA